MTSPIPPLFPYYGSKWRDARRYPAPRGPLVVEPFAGSAGYALWHAPPQVVLHDVDPIVTGVWTYLIGASSREIRRLPDVEVGESTDALSVPQEARWLIGFWLNRGSAQPKKTRTAYSARTERGQLVWGARARERIAASVDRVRHWTIREASFDAVPHDAAATYFVDPPYVVAGRHYRRSAVDCSRLSAWVMSLPGTVVVCEQTGAAWLPFEPLASIKSTRGRSDEVAYVRGADSQLCLFGA